MQTAEEIEEVHGPPVTLGWRLRMALEHAGVSVQQMADELEVSRDTIRRWTHDEIRPKRLYVRAWADLTGVTMDFLVEDELRLMRGSDGFHPKASEGDARSSKTAGRRPVTDNKDSRDNPKVVQQRSRRPVPNPRSRGQRRQGRSPRHTPAETHSYPGISCNADCPVNAGCRASAAFCGPRRSTSPYSQLFANPGPTPRQHRAGSVRWLRQELTCSHRAPTRNPGTAQGFLR